MRPRVVTFPKRVRYFLREPRHASAVLRIGHRAIEATIRRASPGAPREARVGIVSFLQRFGSALNPHLHLHGVGTDGVFAWSEEEPADGAERAVEFFEATALTDADIEALTELVLTPHELLQRRCVGPLADLIPPPRMHRHRYYGCRCVGPFAPHAAMRSAVTATAGPDEGLARRLDEAAHQMGITGEEGPGAPSRAASTLAGRC